MNQSGGSTFANAQAYQSSFAALCSELEGYAETERIFERRVVDFIMERYAEQEIRLWLQEVLKKSSPHYANEQQAFIAFCLLCSWFRRMQKHAEQKKLLDSCRERFGKRYFYRHCDCAYYVDNWSHDCSESMADVYGLGKQLIGEAPHDTGVHAAFAEMVARIFEIFEETDYQGQEQPNRQWLDEAKPAIDYAIDNEPKVMPDKRPYAKYYWIKSRLLTIEGRYDEALALVKRAIDTEDTNKEDYTYRVNKYTLHEQMIHVKRRMAGLNKKAGDLKNEIAELETKAQRIEDKIDSSQLRNLEFLGLFAAIITFTITSVNFALNLASPFLGIAYLMLVLAGILLTVFAGLGFVLHDWRYRWKQNSLIAGIGVVMTVAGILLIALHLG